jgi:hypothetical protein
MNTENITSTKEKPLTFLPFFIAVFEPAGEPAVLSYWE